MTAAPLMAPELVSAHARSASRFGVACGPRFFVLLAVGLICLGPALFDPRVLFAMVAWDVIVLAAWLLDAVRLPQPARLTVRRSWPGPAALGVPSEVTLTLVNESAVAISCTILDASPHQLRAEPPSLRLDVGPQADAGVSYRIVPTARGDIAVGDAYIRYQSPLRIAERWARVDLAQTVVSYPNLEEARRESLSVSRSQQAEVRRQARRRIGMGRAFESLREYRNGDDLRDICWTASARRGTLVTQAYESERSQPIRIVIDSGRLMRARVGETSKLDRAVNAALTLARVALDSGDRVGLLAYGRGIRHDLPASRGSSHLRQIVERLARVSAEDSEADHALAAARLLAEQKRRSLIVWFTDVPDVAIVPDVVQAAAQLMRRHLVLFVLIGQPDLDRLAARRAANVHEMYESAAAQEVSHRRELLLARLRSEGALAFESSVTLSPALVRAYLDVKLRNRL